MEKIYKLHNSIKIEGQEVKELKYDPDEITVELYNRACERGSMANVREGNDKLHVLIFWASVIALDRRIDFSTLSQIKGIKDVIEMADLGRNFITGSEDSDEKNSDDSSESMQEPITPPQLSSKDSD